MSPDDILRLKDKLYAAPDQIDSFVRDNPANFAPQELEIISSWKHFKRGRFYVVRYLKNYAVFLDEGHPAKAYGVQEMAVLWEKMLGPNLPRIVEATLLPFKDKIIVTIQPRSLNSYEFSSPSEFFQEEMDPLQRLFE